MAFEVQDFFMDYVKRGGPRGLFNTVRADASSASVIYVAYQNDNGAYVIEKIAIAADVYTMGYYGSKNQGTLSTDWANRAALTYVEYYQLFSQGA